MARQLAFDLERTPSYDRDDFLEAPSNAEALAMIERWPDWPDRALLLVVGPPRSGKSHLAAIWAERAGALVLRSGDPVDIAQWSGAALVEDCDRAGHDEADLFHLLNLTRERQGWLMITARVPPSLWGIRTPDLLSRLRLAPLVPIGRPDTSLIRSVIVKLFEDRQIRIDEDVVTYAARHCEQSLDAVNRFVAAVDEESLAAGRRITRHLAAKAIAALDQNERTADD